MHTWPRSFHQLQGGESIGTLLVTTWMSRCTALALKYTRLASYHHSQSAMACLLTWGKTFICSSLNTVVLQTWNNLWWPTSLLACQDWIFQKIALVIPVLSSSVQWLTTLSRRVTSTPSSWWCSKTPGRQDRYLGIYSHRFISGDSLGMLVRMIPSISSVRISQVAVPYSSLALLDCKTRGW